MRNLLLAILLLSGLITSCNSTARQEIDHSNHVTQSPPDGIGHYVYQMALPETVRPGEKLEIQMDWRTVGPADGRKRYALDILLNGPARTVHTISPSASTVGEINLVNWLNYYVPVRQDFPAGTYDVAVRLRDIDDQIVVLGFTPDMLLEDGYYKVADIQVIDGE